MDIKSTKRVKRIAVFASGNGTNAENLIRYFSAHPEAGCVVLVVTNRSDAGVIERARALDTEVAVVSRVEMQTPEVLGPLLSGRNIEMIVLAGFLLMIPSWLISRYRIINIHPSLLPRHGGKGMYGSNVHKAVAEAGDRVTGITIHEVTEKYDEGRILFQAQVDVAPTDTPAEIERKVRELEMSHFPEVVAGILNG